MRPAMTSTPPEFVASFRASMPEAYRQQHSPKEIREHAAIVFRRGQLLVHVETWTKRFNAVVLCIVTDDRPGLLTLIRATLVAHGLDVLAAQDYGRDSENGGREAVHFLWLSTKHENGAEVGDEDAPQIEASLGALLRGEVDLGDVIERTSSVPSPPPQNMAITITATVTETAGSHLTVVLEVKAPDRPGLLMTITAALFEQKVSIVRSDVTKLGDYAHGLFHLVETDGSALPKNRADHVAEVVRTALLEGEAHTGSK